MMNQTTASPIPVLSHAIPAAPRRVRRRGTTIARVFRATLVLAIVVVGIALIGALGIDAIVRQFGSPVNGVILRTREQPTPRGGGHYWADYAYERDGRRYEASDRIAYPRFATLKPGRAVPVTTLAMLGRRFSALTFGSDEYWDVRATHVNALIFWLIGAFIILPLALRRDYRYRALRDGVATPGVLVAAERAKTTPALMLQYRYSPADGAERDGVHVIPGINIESPLPVGSALIVFHDPRRPERSVPYELSDFEIDGLARLRSTDPRSG
jgi:hypothetical protein